MSYIDQQAGGRADRQRTIRSADLAASAWQIYPCDEAADQWFGKVDSDRG
ncbi:hypothetical protein [Mesorhizobium sp. J8]|nr:hypothetical protein [Mesorhizobium sp. J8]